MIVGSIGPFDENTEQWSSYTKCFDYFVEANGIEKEKLVPTFLSVMGPKDIQFAALPCPARKACDQKLQQHSGYLNNPLLT